MRDRLTRRLLAALLPAVVLVCVIVLQARKLSVPAAKKNCSTAQCAAKPLAKVSSEDSAVIAYGWAGVGVVLALGLGLAMVPGQRQVGNDIGALERERALLVRACMDVSDTVPSDALKEQLVDALVEAGVTPVEVAAGEPFDSSRHRAVGRVATSNRGQHNLIATTERAGYIDRGKRLRYPDVRVFNANGGQKR